MQTFSYWYNHWCYLFELITVVSISKYKTICDFIIIHMWKVMENQYFWWDFGDYLRHPSLFNLKTSWKVSRGNYPDFNHFCCLRSELSQTKTASVCAANVLVCHIGKITYKLHYIITSSSHFLTPLPIKEDETS